MKDIKVLFMHNSMTWYRIPFFIELSKICNVKYMFTKVKNSEILYKGMKDENSDLKDIDYEIVENKFNIAWKSLKAARSYDYDIILVTVLDSFDQIFEAFTCAIIAKIRRKKVAYFWERWDAPKEYLSKSKRFKCFVYRMLMKLLALFVDTNIVPGSKSKEYFMSTGIPESKITIAHDASTINIKEKTREIRKEIGIPSDKKIILYFGRIVQFKGLDVLIKAFAKLKYKNAFLLICGEGPYKNECIDLANNLKLKNVYFQGLVQPKDRYSYFTESNIFVLPNRFYDGWVEIWGLSTNEAMEMGKPVISTTANGGAYDLIKDGYNGFMVEQNNEDELAEAIEKILENDELEKSMGINSKKIIESEYSYKDMAKGFKRAFYLPFK